jgi:hypothetical protein
MKQTVTKEELTKIINSKLNVFVGQPNDQRTRQRIFNMILSLTKQYPEHLTLIEEIIKEGPQNGNDSKA